MSKYHIHLIYRVITIHIPLSEFKKGSESSSKFANFLKTCLDISSRAVWWICLLLLNRDKRKSKKISNTIFSDNYSIWKKFILIDLLCLVLDQTSKSKFQAAVTNKIKNTEIQSKLEIKITLELIKERQLGWLGHLHIMEEARTMNWILEINIQKNRKNSDMK